MNPVGTFTIKCSNCQEEIDFHSDDADFQSDGGGERQMGPEYGYIWSSDFKCFECNQQNISIQYEVYEYPVGAFNNDKVEITGATELNRFDYNFHEEE